MNQTLDAIDGKQARRTGASSPLGMLLDHGSDSMSATILILTLVQGVALGRNWNLFISQFCILGVFYFASWEEYYLKKTRTQIGVFGVTEGQFVHMSVLMISAIWGEQFFNGNYIFGISYATITIAGNVAFALLMIGSVLRDNWKECSDPIKASIDLVPFVFHQLLLAFWYQTSLYDDYIWLIVFLDGIVFSKMVCKLLICACAE